jgi:autophagy-related protein 11
LEEKLASERARSQGYRNMIDDFHKKDGESQSERETAFTRFEARTNRTKDLTQRIYTYYERLIRLTESLGFVISWQGDEMQITRPSRSSNTESDQSASINRSMISTHPSALEGSNVADLIYWMQGDDAESEAKRYNEFVAALSKFDIEVFREAVTKRVKEVEHVARKCQK